MSGRFKGKRVLVTGASGGIGFQIASDFLKEEAIVGAHYRSNKQGAERLLDVAKQDRIRLFRGDFTDSTQVTGLWDQFIDWTHGIDVLVNNAGEAPVPVPLNELAEESWDRAFQVNVKAPMLLSRAALGSMSEQNSGRIINISSIGVKFGGGVNTVHYSASKAALEAVTMSFAKAGAPYNVLVNAIRAGITDTEFHQKIGRTDLTDRIALIPLKRMAEPAEISDLVLYLAGNKSSFITGAILPVSGGE